MGAGHVCSTILSHSCLCGAQGTRTSSFRHPLRPLHTPKAVLSELITYAWVKFPVDICEAPSLSSFKSLLKTLLCQDAYKMPTKNLSTVNLCVCWDSCFSWWLWHPAGSMHFLCVRCLACVKTQDQWDWGPPLIHWIKPTQENTSFGFPEKLEIYRIVSERVL